MIQQTIVGILMISLMNESGTSAFSQNFISSETANIWADSLLQQGQAYYDLIRKSREPSSSFLADMFNSVDIISDELDTYLEIVGKKYVERFNKALDTLPHCSIEIYQIDDYFNIVNGFYNETRSRYFGLDELSNHKTLEEYFAQMVLQDSISVPTALEEIHSSVLVSSSHEQFSQEVAIGDVQKMDQIHTCDKLISTQQSMFLTYVNLLIIEIKGLATLIYVYALLQSVNKASNYTSHLKTAEVTFKRHIKSYHDKFNKATVTLSREIHRCEIDLPQRGINFIEFVHYHQIQIKSASSLGANPRDESFYLCDTDCEQIDYSSVEKYVGVKIEKAQTIGYNDEIIVCSFDGQHRRYWYWKSQNRIFGHNETCPYETKLENYGYLSMRPHCRTCQLSIITTKYRDEGQILRISVSPQTSDVKNNMIVVGVKFVAHQDAVHLQIQQGKYSPRKMINNHTVWKELDDNHQSDKIKIFDYEMLSEFSGQLHLDDVILPPKYAVTGVRFRSRKNAPEGFYLELRGTPLDLATGKLRPDESFWFNAGNRGLSSLSTSDYKRPRIEIKITDADDPSRCNGYDYDKATNKFVRFTHSSAIKDAGQSTIPYIDAQPVETYPSFPLSGIGLFYRGKKGCGGYVAPRIFTFDISSYT